MNALGEKGIASMAKTNLLGKVKTSITRTAETWNCVAEIKNGDVAFPLNREIWSTIC